MRPGDVYPESGNRLPLLERAELDADGRAIYDEHAADARSLAGFRGPAGILLRSARYYRVHRNLNQFLRFETGIDARLRELAILVTARELDAQFEWHMHEAAAKREGLEDAIVELVRKRKPVRGLGPREAAIVKLGREAFGRHRVRRSTYNQALDAFGIETLVNLIALMGEYAATAAVLAVFAQQLPDGATTPLT